MSMDGVNHSYRHGRHGADMRMDQLENFKANNYVIDIFNNGGGVSYSGPSKTEQILGGLFQAAGIGLELYAMSKCYAAPTTGGGGGAGAAMGSAVNTKIQAQATIDMIDAELKVKEAELKEINEGTQEAQLKKDLEALNQSAGLDKAATEDPDNVKLLAEARTELANIKADKASIQSLDTQISDLSMTTITGQTLKPGDSIDESKYNPGKLKSGDAGYDAIQQNINADKAKLADLNEQDKKLKEDKAAIEKKYANGIEAAEAKAKENIETLEAKNANSKSVDCKISAKEFETKKAEIQKKLSALESKKSGKENLETYIKSLKSQKTAAEAQLVKANASLSGIKATQAEIQKTDGEISNLQATKKTTKKYKDDGTKRNMWQRFWGTGKSQYTKNLEQQIADKKDYRNGLSGGYS